MNDGRDYSGMGVKPQVRRVVSDFRPGTSVPVISSEGGRSLHSTGVPVEMTRSVGAVHKVISQPAKPKLTLKLLWRARPRTFADARGDMRSLSRAIRSKMTVILSAPKNFVRGTWRALPRSFTDFQDDSKLIKSVILSGAKNLWQIARHPRRSAGVLARSLKANWQPLLKTGAAVVVLVLGTTFLVHYSTRFNITPQALGLLPKVSVDTSKIKLEKGLVSYNAATDFKQVAGKAVVGDPTDATNGKNLYTATMGLDPAKGLTFGLGSATATQTPSIPGLPSGAGQSDDGATPTFTLTPVGGGVQQGRYIDNRLQYPSDGGQRFYTFRKNGVAEDILLTKAPGDTASYQWKLNLPSSLEARMMPNGAIGIYSANPNLFGNIQVGDDKSQALLDKARKNGKKDTLAFVLPAPFIKTTDGKTDNGHTKFSLKGNILTLVASDLKRLSYPLSIDPSVVVTTTGDFQTGYDDGMIDYGTSGQINRGNISAGALGTWNSATVTNGTFTTGRANSGVVAYKGYLYVIGGSNGSALTDIQYVPIQSDGTLGVWVNNPTSLPSAAAGNAVAYNGYMYMTVNGTTTVQYAPISTSDGSVGSWTSTSSFTNSRKQTGFLVYNGYLYVLGGSNSAQTTHYNDVQFAHINADGSLGSWHYTHNSTDDNTTFVTGFTNARRGLGVAAYNGYLYVVGGFDGTTVYNDTQYAPINADGTIGAWATSANSFTTPRTGVQPQIADGYLYIMGGEDTGTRYNTVQYTPINANGSIGTWQTANSFATARANHSTVAYNGYLYVVGGQTGGSSYTNSIQYARIQPVGNVGAITQQTSAFTAARANLGTVVANGFLYIVGGDTPTSGTTCNTSTSTSCADIQFCPLNTDGSVGTCHYTHLSIDDGTSFVANGFNGARRDLAVVTYGGYLYIIAGDDNNTTYHNDIQSCFLFSDGRVGACNYTCNGSYNGNTICAAFGTARSNPSAVVVNGSLYIIGGFHATSDTACNSVASNACSDIQYCPLNSNGTVGTCNYTCNGLSQGTTCNALRSTFYRGVALVYGSYLYIVAGNGNGQYIQYCAFNSNGTVATCNYTCNSTNNGGTSCAELAVNSNQAPTAVIYNGYIIVAGGWNGSYLNDVQHCPINSDATVGTCVDQTSAFNTGRMEHGSVIYGGYLYIIGGAHGTSDTACNATASTDCSDIQRMWVGLAGLGGTDQSTTSFTTARDGHTSVAYNGYLYVIGGITNTSATGCTTGSSSWFCNDVQYAPINTNGTVGTWNTTTSFTTPRVGHTSVAYNGYLYVIGGLHFLTNTFCNATASIYCSDVQYALICTGSNSGVGGCGSTAGTVGTWNTTTSFTTARDDHTSVAYNGYLYVIGGFTNPSATGCASNACNDVQYALICTGSNSGVGGCGSTAGTVGTWNTTTSFTTARDGHTSVAYNGYLYIIGGEHSGTDTACNITSNHYCSDVQYALICTGSNSGVGGCGSTAGTVGTWNTTTSFTTARGNLASVVYNGYLYIIGGQDISNAYNDVQYAPINVDGSVGTWNTTTSFTTARDGHTSVAYNGYLYIIGGSANSSATGCTTGSGFSWYCNDVQYLSLGSSPQLANYERTLDVGSSTGDMLQSIVVNGTLACGVKLWYATAGSNGQFGSFAVIPQALAGIAYTLNIVNQRYLLVKVIMDDQTCGGISNITDITLNYNFPPSNPTITTLTANATNVPTLTPAFSFKSSQVQNHNLQYRVKVCTDALLTTSCQTATQVTGDSGYSQTGWSGQDQGGGTAYTGNATLASSTLATYTYTGSPALNWGTTYYWQATACDATDTSNGCTSTSMQNFRTSYQPSVPTLSGPTSGQTGVSLLPEFRLYSTDQDSDYLTYEVDIYDSTCTTPISGSPFDENASQVGWSSQSANSGSAYTAGQTAIYKLQTALTANTTYCWKARTKDPAGTNTFTSLSAGQQFTTLNNAAPKTVKIQGNVNIGGNVVLKP